MEKKKIVKPVPRPLKKKKKRQSLFKRDDKKEKNEILLYKIRAGKKGEGGVEGKKVIVVEGCHYGVRF